MNPRTVHDVLEMLKSYHQERRQTYFRLAQSTKDEWTRILLQQLEKLEKSAVQIIGNEIDRLEPQEKSYLMPGPTITIDPAHAMDCRYGSEPTFQEALGCALGSDAALKELIDLVAGCNAAPSVQELAANLRELEHTRERQIAKFTRDD